MYDSGPRTLLAHLRTRNSVRADIGDDHHGRTSQLNDPWTWGGGRTLVTPERKPLPRASPAMAYDGARNEIVLFGGTMMSDTWVLSFGRQLHLPLIRR